MCRSEVQPPPRKSTHASRGAPGRRLRFDQVFRGRRRALLTLPPARAPPLRASTLSVVLAAPRRLSEMRARERGERGDEARLARADAPGRLRDRPPRRRRLLVGAPSSTRRRVVVVRVAPTRGDRDFAVSARASSSSDDRAGGAPGASGGGFLPDAPRAHPPPTPKRVGPRVAKKRFTGEDAASPDELRRSRRDGGDSMRLGKALAKLGVASRRASEKLVFDRRVTVNGVEIAQPQHPVRLAVDAIAVDGKVVDGGLALETNHAYFLLNKPKGYICSDKPSGARTRAKKASLLDGGGAAAENSGNSGAPPANDKLVLDLFQDWRDRWRGKHPGKLPPRLFTVGRLDVNTTGALLVTTDGAWCQRVAHPSSEIVKAYVVTAADRPARRRSGRMAEGTTVDGAKVVPARVRSMEHERDGGPPNRVLIEVVDGRNREVREICAAAGVGVRKLKRIRVGGLRMPSELPTGRYVALKPHQVGYVLDKGLASNAKHEETTGKAGMF